jgi:serine/threonine-protein kinase
MALGRVVTIRVIAESLRSDDRFTELLASTTERLLHPVLIDGALRPPISHPNAARVFYFDLGSGTSPAFVVMEELEGEPLATLLSREGRLDAEVAVRITIAVARAVHAAHEAGLVHGAVNPANLLID